MISWISKCHKCQGMQFCPNWGGDYQFCLVKPGPKKSMRFDMRDNTHSSPSRKLNWENILFLKYNFVNFISMVCLWVCDYNVVKTPFFTAAPTNEIQSSHHFHTNIGLTSQWRMKFNQQNIHCSKTSWGLRSSFLGKEFKPPSVPLPSWLVGWTKYRRSQTLNITRHHYLSQYLPSNRAFCSQKWAFYQF